MISVLALAMAAVGLLARAAVAGWPAFARTVCESVSAGTCPPAVYGSMAYELAMGAGMTAAQPPAAWLAGNCLLFEAVRNGLTLIGVTLGTPGDDISDTGPVATKVLNWGFRYF
jgi:hypothetical protein